MKSAALDSCCGAVTLVLDLCDIECPDCETGEVSRGHLAFMSIGPALEALAQWGAENVFQNCVVFDIPDNDGVPQ